MIFSHKKRENNEALSGSLPEDASFCLITAKGGGLQQAIQNTTPVSDLTVHTSSSKSRREE